MNCLPCFRSQDKITERAISTKAASPSDNAKENSSSSNAQTFTFRELAMATKNFRQECLLGEGGFGRVFKGKLHSSGQVVAVKQLDRNGMQESKEFHVEVLMLSLLRHPNLVNLVGYCADGDQRLLVYEFMPMGSLEHHLFGDGPDKKPLDWVARMNIAAGAAKGLEYLHEKANPPIIYRDLKPSNVLLDESFEPKLSDFGLAKLGPGGGKTQPASRVMGTYGYSAPEYSRSGELTLKSDIYNFGVVLLELITGRRVIDTTRPNDEQNLVTWAQPIFRDPKRFPELADSRLNKNFPVTSLNQAVGVAAMCLQEEPSVRPLIGDVVAALSFITVSPNESIQPSISTGDAPSIAQPNVYTPPPEQKMEYGDDVRQSTSIKSDKDRSDRSDGSSSDSEDEHSDRGSADRHGTPRSHTSDQDVAHLENSQHSDGESDGHSYRSDDSDGESIYHSDGSEEDSVDHEDVIPRQGSSKNNKDDDVSLNQGSARISSTDGLDISSTHGSSRETEGADILSDHCSRIDATGTSSPEHGTGRKSLTNQLGSSSKRCSSKKLDKRASNGSGRRSTSRRKSSKHRTVVTFKEPSMNSRYNKADKSDLTEPNAESSRQQDEHHRPALEALETGSSIMVDVQDMQTNALSSKENNRSCSNSSSSDSSNDEHKAQDDLHNHRVFDNNKGNMQPNLRHLRTR